MTARGNRASTRIGAQHAHSPRPADQPRRVHRPPHRAEPRRPRPDARRPRRGLARRAARPDRAGVDPHRPSAGPARGALRDRGARRPAHPRRARRAAHEPHRHGLLPHHHARRHPAQRAREPGVVHGLHAVPGRDQPGSPGGPAQLPDDGDRADRAPGHQRLAARRGHRHRRGDGDDPTPHEDREQPLRRPPRHPSADDRGPRHARRADRDRRRRRRSRRARRRLLRCAVQPPDLDRRDRRLAGRDRARARRRRPRRRRHRPAGVRADDAARPARGRHRRRFGPALRRPDDVRRAARRVHRRPGVGGPRPSRAHRRRQHRHRRPPGPAPRPADPRAAHPPREGDVQHLHGAGPAGQHRRLLRRLPRPDRAAADRRAHPADGVGGR